MSNPCLISVTPTVSASPDYADGDNMGGLIQVTLPPLAKPWFLNFVSISSKVDLSVGIGLITYKSNPSATTFTDNGAFSLNAADYDKLLDIIEFSTTWSDIGTPNCQSVRNLNSPATVSTARIFYCSLFARGAINLASVSDLTANFSFVGD